MASKYKTLPSQYHAAANKIHQIPLGFIAQSAIPGHMWNVQTCLICLLTLISISVLLVERISLVLLLRQVVFTKPTAQNENGKHAV